jgi:hypothetical protein
MGYGIRLNKQYHTGEQKVTPVSENKILGRPFGKHAKPTPFFKNANTT